MNIFGFKNSFDCIGGICVLMRDEPRTFFDYGDLAAEATKHLREFKADVTASHNDQMPRQFVEFHHGGVVKKEISWTPGMSGTIARPPTLRKMRSAVSV